MTAFLGFFALLTGFLRDLWGMVRDPKYQGLFLWLGILLVIGLIFYRQVEGWSWVDSLYFSVITLTTIGYGDLSPTTPLSKLFTSAYAILGLTIFAAFLKIVSQAQAQRWGNRQHRRETSSDATEHLSTDTRESDTSDKHR